MFAYAQIDDRYYRVAADKANQWICGHHETFRLELDSQSEYISLGPCAEVCVGKIDKRKHNEHIAINQQFTVRPFSRGRSVQLCRFRPAKV